MTDGSKEKSADAAEEVVPSELEKDYRDQKADKAEKPKSWFESLIAMLGI